MRINTGCWVDGCKRFDSNDEDGVEIKRDREWVGLTEDDLQSIYENICVSGASFNTIALIIEAKLKEKNNV